MAPIYLFPKINNKVIKMEVDTGSDLSIMSYADFNKNFKNKTLEKINVILQTYTGERVEVVGMARVKVEYALRTFML